jgi:hypothetical protein
LRPIQRAAKDDIISLVDGLMNANSATKPRMMPIKNPREERSCGRPQTLLYNDIRTHRSLDKDAPVSRPVQRTGVISSRAILGGHHHHYARV